jgi:hypothetical protein
VGDRQSPAGCDWSTIRHLDLAWSDRFEAWDAVSKCI